MKHLFLVIAVGCLALFIVAGLFVREQVTSSPGGTEYSSRARPPGGADNTFRWQRTPSPQAEERTFWAKRVGGLSVWLIVQNLSAVAGIASFLIQIVQWRRHRRS